MNDKNDNKKDNLRDNKQSVGNILPNDKKHLKEKMPDHLKSPLNEIKDKSDVDPKS